MKKAKKANQTCPAKAFLDRLHGPLAFAMSDTRESQKEYISKLVKELRPTVIDDNPDGAGPLWTFVVLAALAELQRQALDAVAKNGQTFFVGQTAECHWCDWVLKE